jgi:PKD repeat protein
VAHWSLSSGGGSAGVIPGPEDRVIIDDNSFSSNAEETITLDTDALCQSLMWLASDSCAFDMRAHTLSASTRILMLADTFRVTTPGTFQLAADGVAQLDTDLSGARIKFSSGALTIGHSFPGALRISENGDLTLDGDNAIDSVEIAGNWTLNGSNTVKYFHVGAGAQLQLAEQKTQILDTSWLAATSSARIRMKSSGSGNATLVFARHQKICNDYLDIDQVNATGEATVVAGTQSIVTDAQGWVENVACDDALFADFDVAFACDQGVVNFINKSSGHGNEWTWDFGDEASGNNASISADASHRYDQAGIYAVTLTAKTASNETDTYTRNIEITMSPELDRTIASDQDVLTSNQIADRYQWYRNGDLLENATNKTFAPTRSGTYTVRITIDKCDYMSDEFLVTATEPGAEQTYRLSPNPADRTLVITTTERRCSVSIYTSMGQYVGNASSETGAVQIDTSPLQDGLYIADLNGHKIKFLVLHR